MSLLDIAEILLVVAGVGTAISAVLVFPIIWDHYQREQVKKRRNPP